MKKLALCLLKELFLLTAAVTIFLMLYAGVWLSVGAFQKFINWWSKLP